MTVSYEITYDLNSNVTTREVLRICTNKIHMNVCKHNLNTHLPVVVFEPRSPVWCS